MLVIPRSRLFGKLFPGLFFTHRCKLGEQFESSLRVAGERGTLVQYFGLIEMNDAVTDALQDGTATAIDQQYFRVVRNVKALLPRLGAVFGLRLDDDSGVCCPLAPTPVHTNDEGSAASSPGVRGARLPSAIVLHGAGGRRAARQTRAR